MREAVPTLEDPARLEAFEQRTKALGAQYTADAEIAALSQEAARSVSARIKQLKTARLKARFANSESGSQALPPPWR